MRICFVIKSIASYKSSLLALISAKSTSFKVIIILLLSLSKYRAASPSLFIYETILKNYLIVTDLYMRYTSLKSVKSSRSVTTRFIIISILIIKDLYEKFHEKKKLVILTVKCALNSPVNQNSLLRNSKCRSKALIASVKSLFFIKYKFISWSLITQ